MLRRKNKREGIKMELKLPELGEGVHEGELVKWLVKPGDLVKDDQAVCEIMTDKATIELPAPFSGTITSLESKEGNTVKVGETILKYETTGSAAAAKVAAPVASAPAPSPVAAPKASAAVSASVASSSHTSVSIGGPVSAAPATRRFARESGVDLGAVSASGPSGRVMMEDVQAFLSGGSGKGTGTSSGMSRSTVSQQREERIPFKGLRKKIAEKMRQSKDHAAHFTYVEEADATALVELRNLAKDRGAKDGVKVTYLPFVMKAMANVLRKYPIMNSELDEASGEIILKHYYNIALSVQTPDGLTAPVVKDVGNKSVLEIAKEIQTLVEKARAKKLSMDDLTGGTITLTNAGSIGGLFATPVINYPEVSILGFNKIFRKPVAKVINGKEEIVIRDWTYFSISLDHRIVDGAVAAEFMKDFIRVIENPALMILG
jgi:pyruvate dehydrogenase E2 component (dihydrolipoamide acetyltransferase)